MFAGFNAWKETFSDKIVDMGRNLTGGTVMTTSGATDGLLVEVEDVVGGDMLVSADTLKRVRDRKRGPRRGDGSSVEVREIQEMPPS
jgi:hypothetical protein